MQKSIGENMWIFAVAALVAAWIEMNYGCNILIKIFVAALVAAWIEIDLITLYCNLLIPSRPLWPRGLKSV